MEYTQGASSLWRNFLLPGYCRHTCKAFQCNCSTEADIHSFCGWLFCWLFSVAFLLSETKFEHIPMLTHTQHVILVEFEFEFDFNNYMLETLE